MYKYLSENWESVLSLIIQCCATVFAGYIGLFSLRAELRRTTPTAHQEAIAKKKQIYLFTTLGIIAQIALFVTQEISSDKLITTIKDENKRLSAQNTNIKDSLIADNRMLKSLIDGKTANIVKQASDNALKATVNMMAATGKLDNMINGSYEPPTPIISLGYKDIVIVFENNEDIPLINAFGWISDFDAASACPITKKGNNTFIDANCYTKSVQPIRVPYLIKNDQHHILRMAYTPGKNKYKFHLVVVVRDRKYIINMILERTPSGLQGGSIIYLMKGGRYSFYKFSNPEARQYNWEKEFPNRYVFIADLSD